MKRLLYITFVLLCVVSCGNKSDRKNNPDKVATEKSEASQQSDEENFEAFQYSDKEEFVNLEPQVTPSPKEACRFIFSASDEVLGFDLSPKGDTVALIVKNGEKYRLTFWEINSAALSDEYALPDGFAAQFVKWHPQAHAIFVMGKSGAEYQVYNIYKKDNQWENKKIYTSTHRLEKIVAAPYPFQIGWNSKDSKAIYSYRLFIGEEYRNNSFRIISISENGSKFYQVVGPSDSFTKLSDEDEDYDPYLSEMKADWALPVEFDPSGYSLIWENQRHQYFVSGYFRNWQTEYKAIAIKREGVPTATPNGLGYLFWQKWKAGVDLSLFVKKTTEHLLPNYQFISNPLIAPDGRGVVGLTKQEENMVLNFVPIDMPLADVANAYLFVRSPKQLDLLQENYGLFTPINQEEYQSPQLYNLYETENYFDQTDVRPYLTTTDVFWELFGAAYEGLFILQEKDQSIPNFWEFITRSEAYFRTSMPDSKWSVALKAILDFKNGDAQNQEALRIKNESSGRSSVTQEKYDYSELKPRGHYTTSDEMKTYFKAFKYFTTILVDDQGRIADLADLEKLPANITQYAENWINGYSGFIAPSRSPLVWKNVKQTVPAYCQYPKENKTLFPLSWGFDNEVFYSTVYHQAFPKELQIENRFLPSGLDIATVFGNKFAENLLASDYKRYPQLKKVIENLKGNFKANTAKPDFKTNLYNQWLNAMAVQWADVSSVNGAKDQNIWQAKRLQTGLATWATLRHATVLVNERSAAEAGEGGEEEEEILKRPQGYVESDPQTFAAIAGLFDQLTDYVSTLSGKSDNTDKKQALYKGVLDRLKDAAQETRSFQQMAEKELRNEPLNAAECEKIYKVAGTIEHLFLLFNSISNSEEALSNPAPMPKIADVADNGFGTYLMAAVGNPLEWNWIVPFYGRHQIVKGAIYSYYEFESGQLLNDNEWNERQKKKQEYPSWIAPYIY